MSKEEFMNIQTCVLKVNIHCEGCKQKVKKILQKIEGVFTTKIDADQGKVTVYGSVDPSDLIEKLSKSGKHAEILGAPKSNNNPTQFHLANQLKGMQIDNGKGGKNNNNDKGPKHGGGGGNGNPQQIQKMKGFQDLKLAPQLKDIKGSVSENKNQNQSGAKFNVPEEEDYDFSDDDDEFTDAGDHDSDDDEFDTSPSNKMTPNMMKPCNQQMMMNANLGGGPTKYGGTGVHGGGKDEPNGGGGGKGDSAGAGNQSQGGGKNGCKNAGGGHPQDGKNGCEGGGPNAGKKINGGGGGLPAGFLPMGGGGPPNMSMPIGGPMGMGDPMGNIPARLCPMGGAGPSNMTMPIGGPMGMGGLMGNIPAVHGLPATGASGMPPGYLLAAGPDPVRMQQQHQQQQYLAAVMNQQRAIENERFQPMMYARPPLAVNYMPPHIHLHQYPNPYDPYPYPYPPHGNDQYSHVYNEENTSSCDIM
ncbi:hypothetical protein HA466_0151290 [Hirschfeldia incana]|nr:hypothetical protein HA466_0151290 [Hirschfeldia incana]